MELSSSRDRPPKSVSRLAALGGVVLILGSTGGAELRATEPGAPRHFEGAVAALLAERCAKCHNEQQQKGELDLSSAAGLVRGGESGPVFTAGDPGHSHLLELVERGEMPKKGEPLSPEEVSLIREWIEQGARFQSPPALAKEPPHQHDVLPILLLRCAACHGASEQRGGLDLRSVASLRKGGMSGPAITPGNPDGSLLLQRIESEACPPQELLLKYFVKRPPSSEVEVLREWIVAGAPEEDIVPDVATTDPDPLVTEEDRRHWSFLPPQETAAASSADLDIDGFLEARLKEVDLAFSEEADRDTLIRRAYLTLVGMPPPVEEWRRWRGRSDERWYADMIDHLLASPHYGERWGRYWLDLAGYADSEGGISADPVREVAWKYRDYVVDSFNQDKPYDRFLLEQLAGDELVDWESAETITDEMVTNLVATGFLRMGIDQTGSRTMNFVPERLGVIGDAIHVVSSGLMGLTMECVRCHTHKYDPIPIRDYYRMKAIFQGAFDEHDWMSFKTRKLEVATAETRERYDRINPPLAAERKKLEAQRKQADDERKLTILREHYPAQSEDDNHETLVALRKADNQRTQTQAILVKRFVVADLKPEKEQPDAVLESREKVEDLDQQIREVTDSMEPSLAIRALWDRGRPSPTYILRRGEHDRPGRLVGPGVPSALTDGTSPFEVSSPFTGGTATTGRRLAFARWLTRPDHPLTARVMVNRVWYHHFGTGIVKSLENFGAQGAPPSHPELLDWLAVRFVESGWSVKELHRLIMNSQAYRQASRIDELARERDPENRLLSRFPMRRMDAESVRDSLLFVSDTLDDSPGGPPDPVRVDREGLVTVVPNRDGRSRRSIYAQYRRTEIPTMMETFDYPEMGPNCLERSVSTVSPQSLMMLNNARVREIARALARRVESSIVGDGEAAPGASVQVEAVYHFALSRPPSPEERQLGIETLAKLQDQWPENPRGPLEAYCHTILNSAAFVYID